MATSSTSEFTKAGQSQHLIFWGLQFPGALAAHKGAGPRVQPKGRHSNLIGNRCADSGFGGARPREVSGAERVCGETIRVALVRRGGGRARGSRGAGPRVSRRHRLPAPPLAVRPAPPSWSYRRGRGGAAAGSGAASAGSDTRSSRPYAVIRAAQAPAAPPAGPGLPAAGCSPEGATGM